MFQAVVVVVLGGLVWWIVQNTIDNLTRLHIASGFGFLKGRAGFDISDTPIAYTSDSTYGRAILVGFINTLIVAAAGIVTATIIGFIIGIGRLSHNWLIRRSARSMSKSSQHPPLLVIFFWYSGVLTVLPP